MTTQSSTLEQPSPQTQAVQLPFDLTPTEEQRLLVEAFSRFAAAEMRPRAQKADMEHAMPEGLLDQTAALGLHLMAMPEDCGGVGGARDPVLSALAAESLAHGDMAMALAAFAPVSFVHALVDGGTAEQCRRWLPSLADQAFVPATVAVAESGAKADPLRPQLSASRKSADGDWTLQGSKAAVPLGATAKLLLVTATAADAVGEGRAAAFVVEGDAPGLSRQAERWMGLGALELAQLDFDGVRVPAENRLGEADQPFDLERLVSLGRTGLSAAATGVCQAVVDYCVPYCNERIAFGEPISHRQAVAFKLADAATETEGMRLMALRAASRALQGMPFAREAWLAKIQAAEYGMQIGSDGVQLLGGHGFIREHPVELWYRNLRAIALLEGTCIL